MTGATDKAILDVYAAKRDAILLSEDPETRLDAAQELWDFMNRFRNCDLGIYFDEDVQRAIAALNPRRFDTSHLVRPKKEFRMAVVVATMNDTGGAPIGRFLLNDPTGGAAIIKHYFLYTSLGGYEEYRDSEQFRQLQAEIDWTEIDALPTNMGRVKKGRAIEEWLHARDIDFVVIQPCPSAIYALASQPTLFSAVLSQDCYTFTVGPGCGDFTLLVTTDQIFKYRYQRPDADKWQKVVLLPLHDAAYADAAVPISRAELGVPEHAIVSGSTNMWKWFFGDNEILMRAMVTLLRRHPDYHHVFAGTPRCLDNLEVFLKRHPDVAGRIHYAGPVRNIYRFLKSLDFWVNSFPTTGGSDLEAALVGKPSIDLAANRNLNLHPVEFLCTPECTVTSLDDFVRLGSRLITEADYREDLGQYVQFKVRREFDKHRLVKERLYGTFLEAFRGRLENDPGLPGMRLEDTLEYEKRMALYNAHGRRAWPHGDQKSFLAAMCKDFPERPFAWIKRLELAAEMGKRKEFEGVLEEARQLGDHRVRTTAAFCWSRFDAPEEALALVLGVLDAGVRWDPIPWRLTVRLLLAEGREKQAAEVYDRSPLLQRDGKTITAALAELPTDALPLYYRY